MNKFNIKTGATLDLQKLVNGSLSSMTIDDLIRYLGAYLPSQGPLTDFVHHNTLEVFLELPFHSAIATAADLYSAKAYEGVGPSSALKKISLREKRLRDLDFDVDKYAKPLMIRLSAAFFDQGIALVTLPGANLGLWNSLQLLLSQSYIPLKHLSKAKHLFSYPPETAIRIILNDLVKDEVLYPLYLFELMNSLRGWAGFSRKIEQHPELLKCTRPSSLIEWMGVYLAIEWSILKDKKYSFKRPKSISPQSCDSGAQDQFEQKLYQPILSALKSESIRTPEKAEYQAIFCIDDREFSLRYFIEKNVPEIETFGAAGFFGVDCIVVNTDESYQSKHCPPAVQPSARVQISKMKTGFWHDLFWLGASHHVFGSWLLVKLLAIPTTVQFLLSTVSPRFFQKRRLRDRDWSNEIEIFNKNTGFSKKHAAKNVANFLRTIGLTKNFAPFVAIVGHGASSFNNPYFAAYDCGACSGRPGTISARVFCVMANDKDVRRMILDDYLIEISDSVEFVPFIHDTTADLINYLGKNKKPEFSRFMDLILNSLRQNAQFRCKDFEGSPKHSINKAHRHVRSRAKAWYEPRPEYNHANNIGAIIAPRNFGIGLPKEHGLFLHSYDPLVDEDGTILGKILSAVIPVCGGINLEYFFSRVDPEVYGAGNKLPQNVVGVFGVMTGIESDLRTGLPLQMTETHKPARLLLVVLQRQDILRKAIEQHPALLPWVENNWVHLISQDPVSGKQINWKGDILQ